MRARDLIGRKIVGVNLRPFQSHPITNPRVTTTDPEIILDNGRRLRFLVQETDVGEYGVKLILTAKPKKAPSTQEIKR